MTNASGKQSKVTPEASRTGNRPAFVVGTAGWSIPSRVADRFSSVGSGLTRYASVFNGVEINSTFYRRHKPETFERWRESVPDTFRFSVKLPKLITHEMKFKGIEAKFQEFLRDIEGLAAKLGPLLCQLPPTLKFSDQGIEESLRKIRAAYEGVVVIEPRHASWRSSDAMSLLRELSISPVLADPPVVWHRSDFNGGPRYIRLHGSPEIYYSPYSDDAITEIAGMLPPGSWCIFDNTASGAAIDNALTLVDHVTRPG